jgi:Ala-tRNA(Pro) deacylase
MSATVPVRRPYQPLLDWLAEHGIEYDVHEHDTAFTARATARAEGVDPRTYAKVVGVRAHDGRRALMVLDATDHLDLRRAREALQTDDLRLLTEPELAGLAPDCDAGAMPACGSMFGLPTYADFAVREDPMISFKAGSHAFSVRVDRAAWERACKVAYVDLAEEVDARPAWARS